LNAGGPHLAYLEPHIRDIFFLTSPGWRAMLYASPSYEAVWGRPRADLAANPLAWMEAVTAEDRHVLSEAVLKRKAPESGQSRPVEFRIMRPDRVVRRIQGRLRSLPASQEVGPALLLQMEDVTVTRLMEAKVADLEAKLEEAKSAFKMLLEHRNDELENFARGIEANHKKVIQPCLERLLRGHLDDHQRGLLATLEASLKELASPFSTTLTSALSSLTPREIEVAQLVRQGRSNSEIADLLNVSENAVAFHRQHIRAKLGLTKKRINLHSYLNALANGH
jgi:DNA-binding CsgD family transcriptional regulator